ncbi:MAG: SufE family protein [Bdellovibrionales bacterium]|nr:SufE family protein [Bdellovibrionales bacterium]
MLDHASHSTMIQKREEEILQSFKNCSDWESKYRRIIRWGKDMPPLDSSLYEDRWLVQGCQSQLWLYPQMTEGLLSFRGDSDALISKGLLALALHFYSDLPPVMILKQAPEFIEKLDLASHLSPSRRGGLSSLIRQIQNYAQAFTLMKDQK